MPKAGLSHGLVQLPSNKITMQNKNKKSTTLPDDEFARLDGLKMDENAHLLHALSKQSRKD